MDRSLTGDDYRTLERVNSELSGRRFPPAPSLSDLPGWFRRVVAEQAAWLGIPLPGDEPARDAKPEDAAARRAAA